MKKDKSKFQILAYGIEKKSLQAPDSVISKRNYELRFEPYDTDKRFNDFDIVLLFQGTFEQFELKDRGYGPSYLSHHSDKDEIDKRLKELSILLKNGGHICFMLCDPFIDHEDMRRFEDTDLSKICLNNPSFYRKPFSSRSTNVNSKRSEFNRFLELYGAANTYFVNYNDSLEIRTIATVDRNQVGIIISDKMFFIPSLLPKNKPHFIKEFFELLSDALISTIKKLVYDIPAWVETFQFSKESVLIEKRDELLSEADKLKSEINNLRRYKRIVVTSGELLVEAVIEVLKEGFGFVINSIEEYKEDFQMFDRVDEKVILFGEIKGVNGSVKREDINQCDSHRERGGLPHTFPSILIVNNNIKNSRSIDEKDRKIADEQVTHAATNNILIIRTLDLLRLLEHFFNGTIKESEIIDIFTKRSGWLKVDREKWEILR